jgi:tetratricopeptide (TPR) repeat protein
MAEAFGIGNAGVAGDLNNLGALAEGTGDYSQAADYYLRELDLLARLHEAHSEIAGDVYSKLGQVMQIQGRFAEAENNYKKALGLLTQHAGVENWQTAITINRLGRLYLEQGNFQEASSLLPRARATAEKVLPKDDPYVRTGDPGHFSRRRRNGSMRISPRACVRTSRRRRRFSMECEPKNHPPAPPPGTLP